MASLQRRVTLALPDAPCAPELARGFVARQLVRRPPEAVMDAQLVVSELVTNAVVHGDGVRWVAVEADDPSGTIRVSVADRAPRASLAVVDDGGEELRFRVLGEIADRWGADADAHGKVVWCELDRPLADVRQR